MVVPAGLVNNWHRELNEVFNLNFEVFGSEGDVFDCRGHWGHWRPSIQIERFSVIRPSPAR